MVVHVSTFMFQYVRTANLLGVNGVSAQTVCGHEHNTWQRSPLELEKNALSLPLNLKVSVNCLELK